MSRTPSPPPAEFLQSFADNLPVPGAPLPAPTDPSLQPTHDVVPADALVDTLDSAIAYALSVHDPKAYMERLARDKPDLFFKYVQMVTMAKRMSSGPSRAANILSPLGPSPLDRPMQ